jgi:glutaredoxin 2
MEPEQKEQNVGQTEVGVQDDLGAQIIERQIEVIKHELEQVFIPNLEREQKAKARMQEQWEVDKRLYEITIEGFVSCEARMKYEENPEYWALHKKKQQWKFDQEINQHEMMMKAYDQKMEELQKNIEVAQAKLAELDGPEQ